MEPLAFARRVRPSRASTWTAFGLAALAAALVWRGIAFYRLSLDARVDHDDFRVLSPSATIGHGYGVVGTVLILTNLLYLVRKKFPTWRVGSVQAWLSMHVFTGLAGAMLITFHSAFQVRTPIAMVTSVTLLLTVVTGLFGRYMVHFSARPEGERTRATLEAIDSLVPGTMKLVQEGLRRLPPTPLPPHPTLLNCIARIPSWVADERKRRRFVREALHELSDRVPHDETLAREFWRLGSDVAYHAAREVRVLWSNALLTSWRGMHRIVAIAMILSVSVHIWVALKYGYWWIFSQ
ncbi:MAG: hypothetical protein IPK60_15490 [Sandaracinaceae bacterium]|jgi:hypothetical protein|nr:hypothetical protein [Sandaracinaceae bacterium]